jgi:hypothetical protein
MIAEFLPKMCFMKDSCVSKSWQQSNTLWIYETIPTTTISDSVRYVAEITPPPQTPTDEHQSSTLFCIPFEVFFMDLPDYKLLQ